MKYLLIACFLYLASCSHSGRMFETTDPEFMPILNEFWADSAEFGGSQDRKNVPINFATTAIGRSATCKHYHYLDYGTRRTDIEILVNPHHWEISTDMDRKSMIYHELGHCLLGREHNNSMVDFDGAQIKGSIMNTITGGTLNRRESDSYYLHELFNDDLSIWAERFEGHE